MARNGRRRAGRRARRADNGNGDWDRHVAEQMALKESELAERRLEADRLEARIAEQVDDRLESLRIDHAARKLLIAELTRQRVIELPPAGWTAADFLDEDDGDPVPIIEGLHYRGNNTLLVAEYKAGKTTLELNLCRSLVDGEPFLGEFETDMPAGRVAFLNYEMSDKQFRAWLRDMEVENIDRIVPLNLRGWTLPFWEEETMLTLAEWLFRNEVAFVIIDPAARAWRGLVEQEGDNIQLGQFFGALDELKRLADVPNLLISAHTPRTGDGRARGGAEIEAWPDGNWYVRKRKGCRTIQSEGRDVNMAETNLFYDDETRILTLDGDTVGGLITDAADVAVRVVESVGEVGSVSQLVDQMKGVRNEHKRPGITEAVEGGRLVEVQNGRATGFKLP